MKSGHVATALIIVVIMVAMLLSGCGGDATSVGFGGARGYAYQPIGGGNVLVTATSTPPEGYEPVPAGTAVSIQGYPEIATFTHSDGFYYMPIIPMGVQGLVVESPSGKFTITIPIIANRITEGGGHSEGGGGGGDDGDDPGKTTFTQGGWGAAPQGHNAGTLLHNNFEAACPDGVRLGYPNGVTFTSAQQITDFLPQAGTPGVWTTNQTLPITNSTAGIFAGQVLALQLSVSFSMAGITQSGLPAMQVAQGPYTGYTVGEMLILAQRILGSDPAVTLPTSVAVLNDTITKINENFDNGVVDRGFLR
jgi:hypothetical protein